MPIAGILNLNKPSGKTSRDVVNHVQRVVRPLPVGHAGTLDPIASGVLVICVGQATRLIQFVQRMPKHYTATFLLGRRSESDDIECDVVEVPDALVPTRESIEAALSQFVGTIMQRPPAYSALKIAGRRAYELARRGKAVELEPRPITVHALRVVSYEYPALTLNIECGSGTYVRALGRDLAEALGTNAAMSALVRTAIGSFNLADAQHPEETTSDSLPQHIQPLLRAVEYLPRVCITPGEEVELRHGRPIGTKDRLIVRSAAEEVAAVNATGALVAIVFEKRAGELWPAINLGL